MALPPRVIAPVLAIRRPSQSIHPIYRGSSLQSLASRLWGAPRWRLTVVGSSTDARTQHHGQKTRLQVYLSAAAASYMRVSLCKYIYYIYHRLVCLHSRLSYCRVHSFSQPYNCALDRYSKHGDRERKTRLCLVSPPLKPRPALRC